MKRSAAAVLTIAGSDSSGGAGIQADLKTFAALGVYGASAITAVTAQNTQQVIEVFALPPALVASQIEAVASDIDISAAKTGMLAGADTIEAVAAKVREHALRPLVVDPVLVASTGERLMADDGLEAFRQQMLPLATVLTPNLLEAEALLGHPIASWDDVREAARELVAMGAESVVVTGGHREGPAIDIFYDGHEFHEYTAARVDTTNTHGTGCTFASAIAAALAKGTNTRGAVALAKAYVTKALQSAYPIGRGNGPVHHFYRYWQPANIEEED